MAVLHDQRVLGINTDCAEFCTHPQHHDLLAVAAYQLDEASQQRVGRVMLYRSAAAGGEGAAFQLAELAERDDVGVFDAKWRCTAQCMQLGLALADGRLQLLDVQVRACDGGAAAGACDAGLPGAPSCGSFAQQQQQQRSSGP